MQTVELGARFDALRQEDFTSFTFKADGKTVHGALVSEEEFQVSSARQERSNA
jgi:hypothetical protein